jgi:NADH:ubiquinone oxidoreductase subunit C
MERFENAVEVLKNNLEDAIVEFRVPRPRKAYILLKPERHRDAISLILKHVEDAKLSTITGTDLGNEIELNYHMACGGTVTLKNRVPREKPVIRTITDILPGASLYEREVFDLLGVIFVGHPNLKRLMLPENWPKGEYPLRRDWEPHANKSGSNSEETSQTESAGELDDAGSIINVVDSLSKLMGRRLWMLRCVLDMSIEVLRKRLNVCCSFKTYFWWKEFVAYAMPLTQPASVKLLRTSEMSKRHLEHYTCALLYMN